MRIILTPIRIDGSLSVIKAGDTLTINGTPFDFSSLPDGATYPEKEIPCDWIAGPVERVDGDLRLTLFLPHGPSPSHEVGFPQAIINPPDGPIALPFDEPVETEEEVSDVDS